MTRKSTVCCGSRCAYDALGWRARAEGCRAAADGRQPFPPASSSGRRPAVLKREWTVACRAVGRRLLIFTSAVTIRRHGPRPLARKQRLESARPRRLRRAAGKPPSSTWSPPGLAGKPPRSSWSPLALAGKPPRSSCSPPGLAGKPPRSSWSSAGLAGKAKTRGALARRLAGKPTESRLRYISLPASKLECGRPVGALLMRDSISIPSSCRSVDKRSSKQAIFDSI